MSNAHETTAAHAPLCETPGVARAFHIAHELLWRMRDGWAAFDRQPWCVLVVSDASGPIKMPASKILEMDRTVSLASDGWEAVFGTMRGMAIALAAVDAEMSVQVAALAKPGVVALALVDRDGVVLVTSLTRDQVIAFDLANQGRVIYEA